MKIRRNRLVCLMLIFLLICGASFSGCRRSDVLEQKIYTENQQVDEENETKEKDNEEENQNEDQEITSKKETDSAQTERNQQDTQSVKGEGGSGSTEQLKYGEATPDNGEASGSSGTNEMKGNDTVGAGVSDVTGTTPSAEGDKQTVDPEGEEIIIPDSYSKVAAVGSTAAFVEILGGSGRLKASSESFISSTMAGNVFNDTGHVQALWSGDGSTGITGEQLTQLIALLTADSSGKGACLYDDSELTGEQVQMLKDAGIDSYPISLAQSSSEAYKEQVMAIGQILGGDAVDRASRYCSWYDDVMKKASGGKPESSKYTLYLSAWDDNASWQVADRGGSGLAIAPSKTNVRLFDEYLNTGGVINRVMSVAGELGQPRYWYVNPLEGEGRIQVTLNGTMADTLKDQSTNKLTSIRGLEEGDVYLGQDGSDVFPAVITANQEIKQKLETEKLQESLWYVFQKTNASGGIGYGWAIGEQFIYSTIHGNYDIYALPQGICGSWASGTPEGVLASMWVCSKFGGSIDMSEVKSQLDSFYATFCEGISINTDDLLN